MGSQVFRSAFGWGWGLGVRGLEAVLIFSDVLAARDHVHLRRGDIGQRHGLFLWIIARRIDPGR